MMRKILMEKPKKRTTWVLMILGLLLFAICYSNMLGIFAEIGISTDEFNAVWLSFDETIFREYFMSITQEGTMDDFLRTFQINIVSIAGFMIGVFFLSVLAARSIRRESKLYSTAFIFPWLTVLIALQDIGASALILSVGSKLESFSAWMAVITSGAYVGRVLLLYTLFIWLIVVGSLSVLRKYRTSPSSSTI